MITSGIFFSYSSQKDLDFLLSKVTNSSLNEIVLAVGGRINLPSQTLEDETERLTFILEKSRIGKTASYNRALSRTHGDITFLVSGDVRFDREVFEKCTELFESDVGMVIPRVIQPKPQGISERIGGVMWNFHDAFMQFMESKSGFFCGGEFQAVRNPGKILSDNIVNDDEYLCHQVFQLGRKIVYARNILVSNQIPGSLRKLMLQRIRVNYGHMQFNKETGLNSSMSLRGISNIRTIFEVLVTYVRNYHSDFLFLPFAMLFELVSLRFARRDFANGKKHNIWDLVGDDVEDDFRDTLINSQGRTEGSCND